MEKFTFRFDTILSTKEKIEDDRKNKFGISMQKLVAGQSQLEKLSDKKNDLIDNLEERLQKTVEVSELRNLSYNLDMIQDIIDRQTQVVEQLELEAEDKRKDLVEASKQKKIFEKLKEKDYEKYKYTELKKEYTLVDEIVCYRVADRLRRKLWL